MTQTNFEIWFLPLSGIFAIGGAWMVLASSNFIRAILWLGACVFGTACFYLTAGAEFLAAIQVLIYAGAIVILYMISLMLTDVKTLDVRSDLRKGGIVVYGTAVVFTIFVMMILVPNGLFFPYQRNLPAEIAHWGSRAAVLGKAVFSTHFLPLEIAGLILLAAIVGVVSLFKES